MKLFFDRRLGYLVAAPGQETPLASLTGKAGDSDTQVVLQFGQSSDPTSATSIITAPTWTAENLSGGTNITIGLKADGAYSDGDILASESTFTHNATDKLYTFSLSLNTTAIDTALGRGDPLEDDVESLLCNFEVTYQVGGSGGWQSSVFNVPFTIYHDVLYGDEGTPTNADDPDEYALTVDTIVWLPATSSLTGGTSADLDNVPTLGLTVGHTVGFYDTDPATDVIRFYRLTAGTDAEAAPAVVRPDDYATTTNEKVWKVLDFSGSGISSLADDTTPQLGGTLDTNAKQVRFSKGADVASAGALTLGADGNYFDVTGTTAITSIGTLGIGTVVKLHFDAALTLTHHATDLILPSGANITTAANDEAEFVEYATGDWRCVSYTRASGAALVNTALTDIVNDTTPQLGGPLDANGQIVKFAKGADVASAATMTLGDDGNYFVVLGSTTISAITSKGIGTSVWLRFNGSVALTDGASLIVPNGGITPENGDIAHFIQTGASAWTMAGYLRESGLPMVDPSIPRTVWIPASGMKSRTTSGAASGSAETTTNDWNYNTWDFDTTTAENVDFSLVMPSNYDGGTITARFFWTAASGSGTVTWAIKARAFADSDALDTAGGTEQVITDTLLTALDMHVTSTTPSVTIGGTPGTFAPIFFNIRRDVATDTLGVDAQLIGCQILYTGA